MSYIVYFLYSKCGKLVVIRDNKDIVKLYPNSLYFVNKSVYISTFADYNVENRNKAEKILNCSIEKFLDGEKCKEFSIFEYPELFDLFK